MTIKQRLKLFTGLLTIVLAGITLTVYLNQSMASISSSKATLQADSYTVGTSYSGSIVNQFVKVGDKVEKGQKLFEVSSEVLSSDIAAGQVDQSDLSFRVDGDNIILTATSDGTVSSIAYLQGAFVPANKEIAKIIRTDSLYVDGEFHLTPPDYARVSNGSRVEVTLPNNQKINATVFYMSIESSNNKPTTVINARLAQANNNFTITSGTPVKAELKLSGQTFWDRIKEQSNKQLGTSL